MSLLNPAEIFEAAWAWVTTGQTLHGAELLVAAFLLGVTLFILLTVWLGRISPRATWQFTQQHFAGMLWLAAIVVLTGTFTRTAVLRCNLPAGGFADHRELDPDARLTTWRTKQTTTDPPAWSPALEQNREWTEDSLTVVAVSQWFATVQEAEVQATQRLWSELHARTGREWPYVARGDYRVLQGLFQQWFSMETFLETQTKDFGKGHTGRMFRAHYRLSLTPDWAAKLVAFRQVQSTEPRVIAILGWFLEVTLLCAIFAGYMRLNRGTQGRYAQRLRLATVVLMLSTTLSLLWLISSYETLADLWQPESSLLGSL